MHSVESMLKLEGKVKKNISYDNRKKHLELVNYD